MSVWYRAMSPRRPDEPHRVATSLELLFDLCFVVAVAQAGVELEHSLAEGHGGQGVFHYALLFFAIWWAWVNFTWFASAYDTDDAVYRLTTLVQIAGALTLAAGVPRGFEHDDFTVITIGYVIMRLAMVVQWLRAAGADPERRTTALRYALGITLVQVGWVARLWLPDTYFLPGFLLLAAAEVLVPIWAERANQAGPGYHPHHIAERYGLFTIIVLGESITAATIAVQAGLAGHQALAGLLWIAGSGLVIVFAMWWIYFDKPTHHLMSRFRTSFIFGYGHYLILSSAAAVGAGIAVTVAYAGHHAQLGRVAAGYALAVPAAVYVLTVWALHLRHHRERQTGTIYPVIALLMLATPFTPVPYLGVALCFAVLVAFEIKSVPAERHA